MPPEPAKTAKFPAGTPVKYPASKAKPPAFAKGEGEVAEVIAMNNPRDFIYRVKDAGGAVLPVAFTQGELRKGTAPAPEPAPEPRPVPEAEPPA